MSRSVGNKRRQKDTGHAKCVDTNGNFVGTMRGKPKIDGGDKMKGTESSISATELPSCMRSEGAPLSSTGHKRTCQSGAESKNFDDKYVVRALPWKAGANPEVPAHAAGGKNSSAHTSHSFRALGFALNACPTFQTKTKKNKPEYDKLGKQSSTSN